MLFFTEAILLCAVQNQGITLILVVKNGTWVVRSWFGQILSKILDC